MKNNVLCDCCKNIFKSDDVVSSDKTIFDDEFQFVCLNCLSNMMTAENEQDTIEYIKDTVASFNVRDEFGYGWERNKSEDYELTYCYDNKSGEVKNEVLLSSENLDYIINLVCKLTD